ncbi:hypothetical protein [Streptomyces halobius]|uniref:Lipoprotein LpqS n=1 Tax=Streptomyces halobius TaxID=2879846 RepID=A0ABY4M3U4_9ACTN|nr:hypothetical protein [Streptomyces halobius]UQA91066.1 hypothetical protein K9S39_03480 [Streptomyces halobius]
MPVVLSGLLLWAFGCSAPFDGDSHAHSRTPVSSGHFPLTAEAAEREVPGAPHPHPGPACEPYAVSHVLPQARQLFTDPVALAALAAVAAVVTAVVAVRQQAARPEGTRSRRPRSGRTTLAVVCRWQI